MASIDAIILAGGRAGEEMACRTGTPVRALFPYEGKPFVQWVYEALRGSGIVGRIAVIGPPELADVPGARDADVLVEEAESIDANLFGALERLKPEGRVLITACDNPLLTTAAFDDFIARAPADAAVAYPILRHQEFLARFTDAANVAITLRDGRFIGGCCVLIQSRSIPRLQQAVRSVLAARKSKWAMVRLLGGWFALQFRFGWATCGRVEQRMTDITGLPICFVRDCDPVFPIDIDDPEDWDYLLRWSASAVKPAL